MFKNSTPRQIALISSFANMIVVLSLVFGLSTFSVMKISYWEIAILAFCIFLATYFIFFYLLKQYIFRKIKLIYKSIHTSKTKNSTSISDVDFDSDVIQDVEKEVAEWAIIKQKEIENLKMLETYRREFLGNISHELKTPLFNIQGYIYTLLDGALYDEKINKQYLERAATNTERLHLIVEDLDVISRLESGKKEMNITEFNIRKLAEEVIQETEMFAQEKGITIGFKNRTDDPFIVKADRENIRQVFINLIINSIKYGKENGQTKIAFYDMDDYILVEVADNGIGIEQSDIPHIFDRFYRVEKSRDRTHGGSGLGLSIVKHIIEAHQQTVNVRSNTEVGSTFGFTLAKA